MTSVAEIIIPQLSIKDSASLALSSSDFLPVLKPRGLWRFPWLALNGDRAHNPEGMLETIEKDGLLSLSAQALGTRLFSRLNSWHFPRLARVELSDCLFEDVGAKALEELLAKHSIRELGIHRCFLSANQVSKFADSARKIHCLSITEINASVTIAPALAQVLLGSSIQELTLRGCFELGSDFAKSLGTHVNMRILRLLDNPLLSDTFVCSFCDYLKGFESTSSLRHLDFSALGSGGFSGFSGLGTGSLTDIAGRALSNVCSAGLCLTELRLMGHLLTKTSLAALLVGGTCLRHIDVSGNSLGNGDVVIDLPGSHSLRVLRIGGGADSFEDEQGSLSRIPVASFTWASAALTSLIVFDVSAACIEDQAVIDFCDVMASTSHVVLREMVMSQNLITETGVEALIRGLRQSKASLERLDLGMNSIGDEGCLLLGLALRNGGALERLSSLSLRANAIGKIDQVCCTLASSVLCVLDLRENLLVDRDARRLVGMTPQLSRSIMVRLSGNDLSDDMWSELNDPECIGDIHLGSSNKTEVGASMSFKSLFREQDRVDSDFTDCPKVSRTCAQDLMSKQCGGYPGHEGVSTTSFAHDSHLLQKHIGSLEGSTDISSAVIGFDMELQNAPTSNDFQECKELLDWAEDRLHSLD